MSDNEEENSDEVDLILAQQIIDDLDVLLPIAGGGDHLNQGPDSSNRASEPENLSNVKFSRSSGLHPLYSLDPSLRLLTAARNGDLKQVEEALALGADPNMRGHDGSTALMQAAREGNEAVAELLLALPGIEPNVRDFEGDTALSHACCCGSLGVAKLLVAKRPTAAGSTGEDLTVYGEKSLGEGVVSKKEVPNPEVEADLGEDAINNRDSDEVNKVDLDHDMPGMKSKEWNEGTDINTGDLDGVTPLHKAIANNWGEIVDLLLEQPHLKVNLANKYGFTALILAAGMGNLDIVSKLALRSEVNVNCVEGNLCSALMIACMHGYLRIADLLLQRPDIDVSLASSSGYTSLITACYKNQVGIAQLLLARDDVEPNWVSDEGDSLVMTCCVRGYTEVTLALLSRPDLNVNFTGKRELSPLMLACIEGNRRVVECILEREDVEINTIGKDGVTALGLACLQGDLAIVEMLLGRQEIEINTCTEDGVSPFTVSVLKSHEQISRLFLNRPDLVLASDSEVFLERGVDPLHVAAAKGQVDIVRRLIRFGCDVDMRRGPSFSAIPVALMKCQNEEALVSILNLLVGAGCKPDQDCVRLAQLRWPQVQELLQQECSSPTSLLVLSRKAVWGGLRRKSEGKNIAPLLTGLARELPGTLVNFLRF